MGSYFKEIKGKRFGKWLVVEDVGLRRGYCICRCDCGKEFEVIRSSLPSGRSVQCQPCAYEEQAIEDIQSMVGKSFGNWRVISFHSTKHYYRYFSIQCKCGHSQVMNGSDLKKGRSLQCYKCNSKEDYGLEKSIREKRNSYASWRCMIARCTNPKWPSYKYYGLRGVTVCEEWKNFENFYGDMAGRAKDFSLDRKDNSKGYCKENCCWKSKSENSKRGR